ncbi:MAG: helix-turn-helix domain-containing protein [Hyphomicrobiaceae bacterium]|jgi:transcriptional regulator with XRE-family HTH domain|nr:helix-turn-helix domain-containing protein [Hyphomicrobiaceae bacterium]
MKKSIPPRVSSQPIDLRSLIEKRGPAAVAAFDTKLAVLQAARLVREARAAAKLSQQELAQRAETTQSAISDIERGVGSQGPTIGVLGRILHACNSRLQLEATLPTSHSAGRLDAAFLDLRTVVDDYAERASAGREVGGARQAIPIEMIDLVLPIETFAPRAARLVQIEQVTGANSAGYRVTVIDEDTATDLAVAAD